MAIRLPHTRLVPGGALRTLAEQGLSKPPTEGVTPGSSLRGMVSSPIIGGEPAGSQKIFSVRPEVNPAANLTSPALAGGPSNVVPAAPAYVPPAPSAGLPTAEEAQSIIRDAISGVTGAPSAVAQSMAPSSDSGQARPGSVLASSTGPVGNLRPMSVSANMVSPSFYRPGGVPPLTNPGGGGGNMPGRNILGGSIIGAIKGQGENLFNKAKQGVSSVLSNIVPTLSTVASKAPAALDFLSRFIPSPLRVPFLIPNLPGKKQGGKA